jgi:uncharacterized membrane protein
MLGALYALISAASFGLNSASIRRGVITSTTFQALAVTVPLGVPLFFIVAIVAGELDAVFTFDGMAYVWLSLAGIFHFVWGRYCGYRAVKAIGANLAGPVQQVNLIMSVTLAIIWLDEQLTPLRVFGLILIAIGPAVMVMGRRKKAQKAKKEREAKGSEENPDAPKKFEPKFMEGYIFASLTATGYGLSPIFVRLGLEHSDKSIAAGLISYFAASIFFCLFLIPKGRISEIRATDRKSLPWFLFSGVAVCVAQMFRYAALTIAPVSVVTPIQRTSIVFRTLFSTLVNREHEILDGKMIVGMVISLLGALALAVSIDMIAPYLDLPREFMEWRWP